MSALYLGRFLLLVICRRTLVQAGRKVERCVLRSHEDENNPLKGRNRFSQSVVGIEKSELECTPHPSAIVTTTDQDTKLLVWYVNYAITDDSMVERMRRGLPGSTRCSISIHQNASLSGNYSSASEKGGIKR